MAGVLAISSHATTPNERPSCVWLGASCTTATPCTPGVARSSLRTEGGTEATTEPVGQAVIEKVQNGSASVLRLALALPPPVTCVTELRAPIAALATKRAMTRPLTKRKAALGL